MARRLVLLLALVCALPSTAHAGENIVGGRTATRDYPYQVLVQPKSGGHTYMCGGSLVAARFVITAAHCVYGMDSVSVAVGITNLGSITSDHVYLNVGFQYDPAYDDVTNANDVAVLTLPRPAPQAQLALPTPAQSSLWATGVVARAIGWGDTTFNGTTSQDLLEVDLPIISDTQCGQAYGTAYLSSSMVCAGEVGKDTCQGDSGGPLLAADGHDGFVLAGVTSWGDGCGTNPGVYTRVGASSLNSWLRTKVPQVDLTQSAAGQDITYTATAKDPYGSGPYGGYDSINWDLDGDGQFDDAPGVLSVTRPAGSKVSVRAANATTGDAEIRTVGTAVAAPAPSAVSFAGGDVTVTEGQAVTLTVAKSGPGAGSVVVTPHSETADGADVAGGPQTLTFTGDQSSQTVTIATVDDSLVEGPETFRVDLGGHTGSLTPASPGSVTVTIADNDVAPPPPTAKLLGVKGRTVRVRTSAGGRVRALATDHAGHVLAQVLARKVGKGVVKLKLKLTARGRAALHRHRRVAVTLRVTYTPSVTASPIALTRKLTLKR